jgi:N-succinyldiaminopimelate aminotransferase
MAKLVASVKAGELTPSLIARLSQQTTPQSASSSLLNLGEGVLNLGEGVSDLPLHAALLNGLHAVAHQNKIHQHVNGPGLPGLRQWVSHYLAQSLGHNVYTLDEVTITCGATQALTTALLCLLNPGDEVIVFEPFYEPYLNMIKLAGGTPVCVSLHPPHWHWTDAELAKAFTPRTKAVLFNNPHNPTAQVFSPAACQPLINLAKRHGTWLIHDAAYADWRDDAHAMAWLAAQLPQQTLTIGSFSKSLRITGWRLGYVCAPSPLIPAIHNMHECLTCEAPVPLQAAVLEALTAEPGLMTQQFAMAQPYRQLLGAWLDRQGFEVSPAQGAVYLWAKAPAFMGNTALAVLQQLQATHGVTAIPADSFYQHPPAEGAWLRWHYLRQGVLQLAG